MCAACHLLLTLACTRVAGDEIYKQKRDRWSHKLRLKMFSTLLFLHVYCAAIVFPEKYVAVTFWFVLFLMYIYIYLPPSLSLSLSHHLSLYLSISIYLSLSFFLSFSFSLSLLLLLLFFLSLERTSLSVSLDRNDPLEMTSISLSHWLTTHQPSLNRCRYKIVDDAPPRNTRHGLRQASKVIFYLFLEEAFGPSDASMQGELCCKIELQCLRLTLSFCWSLNLASIPFVVVVFCSLCELTSLVPFSVLNAFITTCKPTIRRFLENAIVSGAA